MENIKIKELRLLINEAIQKQMLAEAGFVQFLDDAKNRRAISDSLDLLKKIASGAQLSAKDLVKLPGTLANVVPVLTQLAAIVNSPREMEKGQQNAENAPTPASALKASNLSNLGARFQKGLKGIGSMLGLTESQQRFLNKIIKEELAIAIRENSIKRVKKSKKD